MQADTDAKDIGGMYPFAANLACKFEWMNNGLKLE